MTLVLVKTDSPDPAVVGQPLTYTVAVTNIGPGPANNVVLTDTLPASVTFVSSSTPCTLVGTVLTCNLDTIAVGATRTVTIVVTPNAPGMITNVASATGSGQNVATDVEVTQVLQATTLTVTKTSSPSPAFVGGILNFTVAVANTGAAPAENVVLTDILPASVVFVSANVPCALVPATNTLTCNLDTIPAGAVSTVTIQVRPTVPGTVTNVASAQGTNTNLATDVEEAQVILAADLAVTKTANATAQVNQGLTFTVTVTNNGPSTATGVTLVDTLTGGVRIVAVTPTQGTCSIAGQTITCLIGTLLPGETETVTILTVPTGPGTVTNTATVFGNEFDPNPANNTATVTVTALQCCTGFIC